MDKILSEIYRYFLAAGYQRHNIARLQHLESLQLDLADKSVLEFGAGVGDHTLFYLMKNCRVFPTDARPELVDFIKRRFELKAEVLDIEKDQDRLRRLPVFDIIHCYGILYHVSNPGEFLDLIAPKASLLLLESCVSPDAEHNDIHLTQEPRENLSQSVSGTGCRPTRRWILEKLRNNYPHVYLPKTQPKHPEFPVDWREKFTGNGLIRAVFVASHQEIKSPVLQTELPLVYQPW
jgi:cyclopropane fatty-acyl-phospholipid synthase-like methyltransferase